MRVAPYQYVIQPRVERAKPLLQHRGRDCWRFNSDGVSHCHHRYFHSQTWGRTDIKSKQKSTACAA
ncbi:MAG: hypothetical protein KME25_26185 [Symplocastrum torsivum CPER-KK1]|uniref:Uncharacterized protein n=1 Tax=Symplocastrum torsivum CPER-KK1 TaxID=450513 RepID=A0A951UBX1_9CYAN|nr:hypothetical protein [Symplocastrum torsivum CPER-KK1]